MKIKLENWTINMWTHTEHYCISRSRTRCLLDPPDSHSCLKRMIGWGDRLVTTWLFVTFGCVWLQLVSDAFSVANLTTLSVSLTGGRALFEYHCCRCRQLVAAVVSVLVSLWLVSEVWGHPWKNRAQCKMISRPVSVQSEWLRFEWQLCFRILAFKKC